MTFVFFLHFGLVSFVVALDMMFFLGNGVVVVVGGLFLFLAVQDDRLILGQCESDGGVVLFGYSTRSIGNWAAAAQESL